VEEVVVEVVGAVVGVTTVGLFPTEDGHEEADATAVRRQTVATRRLSRALLAPLCSSPGPIVVLNQHSPPGIGVSVGGHGCSRGRFT
jgi:hypothetical protein